jgi:hypothetical protein
MAHSERGVGQSDNTLTELHMLAHDPEEPRLALAPRGADADDLRRERDLLRRTLDEQAQQLVAARARARRQADRLAELRSLLLDAHEQLALRDQLLVGLGPQEQMLVDVLLRTRSWRHRLKLRLGLIRE